MRRKANDINIAPLVDVLLVLLIIFMVTAPMLVKEIFVDLPTGVLETKSTLSKQSLVTISLNEKKQLFLNGEKVTETELLSKIHSLPKESLITIEASKSLNYQVIYYLLMQLCNSGFYNLSLSGYY